MDYISFYEELRMMGRILVCLSVMAGCWYLWDRDREFRENSGGVK